MSHLLAAGDAKPFIDWTSLGKVAGVSLLFALAVVVLFSIGVIGLSMARGKVDDDGMAVSGRGVGSLLAGACFVVCAGAVAYGLWLIVPQFH